MSVAIVRNSNHEILKVYQSPIKPYGSTWGDPLIVTHVEFDHSVLSRDLMAQDDGAGGIEIVAAPDTADRKHDEFIKDIEDRIDIIFGTNNKHKMTWNFITWLLMEMKPDRYSNQSLVDDADLPLDTDAKIVSYARSKLSKAINYTIYLKKREKQFKDS